MCLQTDPINPGEEMMKYGKSFSSTKYATFPASPNTIQDNGSSSNKSRSTYTAVVACNDIFTHNTQL